MCLVRLVRKVFGHIAFGDAEADCSAVSLVVREQRSHNFCASEANRLCKGIGIVAPASLDHQPATAKQIAPQSTSGMFERLPVASTVGVCPFRAKQVPLMLLPSPISQLIRSSPFPSHTARTTISPIDLRAPQVFGYRLAYPCPYNISHTILALVSKYILECVSNSHHDYRAKISVI